MTATFEEVSGGTEVTLVFENPPSGLRAADNEAGSRLKSRPRVPSRALPLDGGVGWVLTGYMGNAVDGRHG